MLGQHEHAPRNSSGNKRAGARPTASTTRRASSSGFGFAGVHGKAANFTDGRTPTPIDLRDRLAQPRLARQPVRGRRLLHPRRLDAAGPGQLRPAEEGRDHRRTATASCATPQWWGVSGTGGLQVHAAPGRHRCAPTTSTTARTAAACSATRFDRRPSTASAAARSTRRRASPGDARRAPTATRCRSALNYLFDENTTFKVEYRLDGANQPVFVRRQATARYRKNNSLFGASVRGELLTAGTLAGSSHAARPRARRSHLPGDP
ncbi:MAG: hypothetical protein MZW92_30525 [Comamonadaceae bacterium]|nr:hypothetical protein [Comamonadaceae bacterium]